MKVLSFFDLRHDPEKLDLKTVHTVPDQSLSVRDILTRFSRGQIEIPPIETGEDDDIDSYAENFEDIVDAHESIALATSVIGNIQKAEQERRGKQQSGVTAEQGGALTEDVATPE